MLDQEPELDQEPDGLMLVAKSIIGFIGALLWVIVAIVTVACAFFPGHRNGRH